MVQHCCEVLLLRGFHCWQNFITVFVVKFSMLLAKISAFMAKFSSLLAKYFSLLAKFTSLLGGASSIVDRVFGVRASPKLFYDIWKHYSVGPMLFCSL